MRTKQFVSLNIAFLLDFFNSCEYHYNVGIYWLPTCLYILVSTHGAYKHLYTQLYIHIEVISNLWWCFVLVSTSNFRFCFYTVSMYGPTGTINANDAVRNT